MTITNKGNYAIIDTGSEQYSIAKGAVIITKSEDSIQLRLNGSRKVLVSFPDSEYTIADLVSILY